MSLAYFKGDDGQMKMTKYQLTSNYYDWEKLTDSEQQKLLIILNRKVMVAYKFATFLSELGKDELEKTGKTLLKELDKA